MRKTILYRQEYWRFLCLFIFWIPAFAIYAEERVPVIKVIAEKDILPSSVRDVHKKNHGGFSQTIEIDAVNEQLEIADVLQRQHLAQIRRTGGVGSHTSVSLRGVSGSKVNMFLDGFLLNSPFTGGADLQSLPIEFLESIDIYPDITPSVLPGNNLGGAVQFKSKELSNSGDRSSFAANLGSFGMKALDLSHLQQLEQGSFLASINHLSSDNNYPVPKQVFRANNANRQNDAYVSNSIFLKADRDFEEIRTGLLFQSQDYEKELPTINNLESDHAFNENTLFRLQGTLEYALGFWELSHRLSLASQENLFDDSRGSLSLLNQKNIADEEAVNFYSIASIGRSKHEYIVSLDLRSDTLEQQDLIKTQAILEGRRNQAVISASDFWQVNNHWLSSLTLRHYQLNEVVEFFTGNNASYDDNDHLVAWHWGNIYQLKDYIAYKLNLAKNTRVPFFYEKYGSMGNFVGNQNLKPESAYVFDSGIEYESEPYTATVSVFYKQINDGIYHIFDSRGVGHPLNISQSDVLGFELSNDHFISTDFQVHVSYTILDSVNQSNIKAHQGQHLPGIYHQKANLKLVKDWRRWQFEQHVQRLSDLYFDPSNSVLMDAQTVFSTSARYQKNNIAISVRVDNLFNEALMSYNRMPLPGRTFFLGLKIKTGDS